MAGQGTDTGAVLAASTGVTALGTISTASAAIAVPLGGSTVTLAAATPTATFPAPVAGAKIDALITQDATGSRVVTWAATSGAVKWSGSSVLSTAASTVDKVAAWSDGTNWYAVLTKAFS